MLVETLTLLDACSARSRFRLLRKPFLFCTSESISVIGKDRGQDMTCLQAMSQYLLMSGIVAEYLSYACSKRTCKFILTRLGWIERVTTFKSL